MFREMYLRRVLAKMKRDKKFSNFNVAKSVGLIFNYELAGNYEEVHSIVEKLRERNIDVKVLGFVPGKKQTGLNLPVLSMDFFYPSAVSFTGYKNSEKVKEFLTARFDVCIDLSRQNALPLLIAMAKSAASFKIGRFTDKYKAIYDLMITLDQNTGIEETFNQIEFYINQLSPV